MLQILLWTMLKRNIELLEINELNILLLSPHTDDAELGCGGSIFKLLEKGHHLNWMVVSTAEESLPDGLEKNTLRKEFENVIDLLNIKYDDCSIFNFKVRELAKSRQQILDALITARKNYSPDLVICPSLNDFHQDHQVLSNEAVRAFKTTSSIICYELPWNHISFNTQLFIRLSSSHIENKWKILQEYESQLYLGKRYFSKEFIYGLAKARGVQCNSEYAEAFEVLRWMI